MGILLRRKYSPFGLLLLFCLLVNGQLVANAHFQQNTTENPKIEAEILKLCEQAHRIQTTNQDSALTLVRKAFSLAQTINFRAGLYESYFTKGTIYTSHNQTDSAFVSLEKAKIIAEELGDKRKLSIVLNLIGFTYNNISKKRLGLKYIHESYEIANSLNDKPLMLGALMNLGRVYTYLTVYDTSEVYLKQALAIQREFGNKDKEVKVLRILGNTSARANDLEKAMDYYWQGVEIAQSINDKEGEASIYSMMGYSNFVLGNPINAVEYYQKGLELYQDNEDLRGIAGAYFDMSKVYISIEDYDKGLDYAQKASIIWEEQEHLNLKLKFLTHKADIFVLQQQCDSALNLYNEVFRIKKEKQQTNVNYAVYFGMGNCFHHLEQLDSALFYFNLVLKASTDVNDFIYKAKSLNSLGEIHIEQNNLDLALAHLKESMLITTTSGLKEQEMRAAELLYRIYKTNNQLTEALSYHEVYRNLQDSLFNKKNVRDLAVMEANYKFEQEKQRLKFEQEQELKQQTTIQRIILFTLIGLVIFLATIIRSYLIQQRSNKKLNKLNAELLEQKSVVEFQKTKLEELDQAKSRFFTNISHEFRTPLTIILGMVDQISSQPNLWKEKGTQMIRQNANQLLNLINQILDLRKLESNELQLNMVQGDIIAYLRYITESFHSFANSKGLQLHFLSEEAQLDMDYDPEKLIRIVSNLLSNAIKYTEDGGQIYFQTSQRNNNLEIRVRDTGTGIPQEQLGQIFDRFYQVDDSTTRKGEGTGIGLALTKELVQLMGGRIEVQSEIGKGTTFLIKLPITHQYSRQNELTSSIEEKVERMVVEVQEIEAEAPVIPIPSTDEDLPNLLIVEDNPDVTQFLISCLSNEYRLSTATNGQEGIDKALDLVPDLIVSDVMMPEKDGFELCDTLKKDERTSHIPIILLTAKADFDSKLAGLERGADAYLTKPFEQKELLIRLNNLLAVRKKLQERFSAFSIDSIPKDLNPKQKNPEEQFIQKLQHIVLEHIEDEDFGIIQLCRAIGLSRTQLHNKIKALTGKSTSIYIRSIRLHKAKNLLQTTDLSISEIAYEVGFKDPKYFSRTFIEEFGEAPSRTRK